MHPINLFSAFTAAYTISLGAAQQLNFYTDDHCGQWLYSEEITNGMSMPTQCKWMDWGGETPQSVMLVDYGTPSCTCQTFIFYGGDGKCVDDDDPMSGFQCPCTSKTDPGDKGHCLKLTGENHWDFNEGVDWQGTDPARKLRLWFGSTDRRNHHLHCTSYS